MMQSGKGVLMNGYLCLISHDCVKKRLAEKQSTSESQVEEKIEAHVRKPIDTS